MHDYSNKRVAVIGNGSSGIQIIPQMAKLPGTKVISFQRKPTYIYYRMPPSKLLGRPNISGNPEYTDEDRRKFREEPGAHKAHRRMLVHRINKAFKMVGSTSLKSVLFTNMHHTVRQRLTSVRRSDSSGTRADGREAQPRPAIV